ncbi:FixH family protein [Fulvivirgaceae bacterium PWU5]|uniref:FixH family protein n=1 Tax=Dawidia cretensis TaxID=2782350 RepID=A0AAP2DX47_9BACT|nr:FixH family protein [Dawidia cretensis]MBT1709006.1 FixH family protein [Dawidia cretensis]
MNWGKSIILAFILFASFIAVLVTVCMRQDVNLVSKNYYQEELKYQDQIDRIANTALLANKPVISTTAQHGLTLSFDQLPDIETGELKLFCPANAAADRTFVLKPTPETTQVFGSNLPQGRYRARMTWRIQGREFYLEQIIHL